MKLTLNNIKDIYHAKLISSETMELAGYELLENLFVDSSGFGADDEPAMSIDKMESRIAELIKENKGQVWATIRDAGQFQVNIGIYTKAGKRLTKRIANNTTIRIENGYRIIRYYDTDIIKETANGIILDNGGYNTRSTNQRLNRFTDKMVYSKEWQVFINDKPLENGKEIQGNIRL